MIIITNRKMNKGKFINGVGNHEAFGDEVNLKGPNEIRIAHAEKKDGNWEIRLKNEPSNLTQNNLPSKKTFEEIKEKLLKEKKNCVFFVHGFNQDFEKNLEKSLALEEKHGVEVVAFSWLQIQVDLNKRIYYGKRNALASLGALDATLEKLGDYLKQPFNKKNFGIVG